MKQVYNYLLAACVLVLAIVCFLSINSPLSFERQRAEREVVVRERLQTILHAQELFCRKNGHYAETFDMLVHTGLLAESLQYVPFSDHERFLLRTTIEDTPSGRDLPLMECGAHFQQYLKGLDGEAVARLTEEAERSGNFPGVKVGGL